MYKISVNILPLCEAEKIALEELVSRLMREAQRKPEGLSLEQFGKIIKNSLDDAKLELGQPA